MEKLDRQLAANYAFPPSSNDKHYLPYDQTDSGDFTFELENNPDAIDFGLLTKILVRMKVTGL